MEKIAITTFYTVGKINPGETLSMFFDDAVGELRVTHVEIADMEGEPRFKITGELWGNAAVREKAQEYEIFQMINRALDNTARKA